MKVFHIHPIIRIGLLTFLMVGVIVSKSTNSLLLLYILFFIPLIVFTKNLRTHLRLLVFGILPILLSFILIYKVLMFHPWEFIVNKVIKILLITTTFQLVLTIPKEILFFTLKYWRLSQTALITTIGAFTVWEDIRSRTNHILTARFARGFIPKRTVCYKMIQLPYLFIPLVVGIMRTSTERAEMWLQNDIITKIENYQWKTYAFSRWFNFIIISVAFLWACFSIYCSFIK
jgi:hypothetical protein